MKWVVRILGVLILAVVAAGAAAFFLLKKDVSAESQVLVAGRPYNSIVRAPSPASSVACRLACAPFAFTRASRSPPRLRVADSVIFTPSSVWLSA